MKINYEKIYLLSNQTQSNLYKFWCVPSMFFLADTVCVYNFRVFDKFHCLFSITLFVSLGRIIDKWHWMMSHYQA